LHPFFPVVSWRGPLFPFLFDIFLNAPFFFCRTFGPGTPLLAFPLVCPNFPPLCVFGLASLPLKKRFAVLPPKWGAPLIFFPVLCYPFFFFSLPRPTLTVSRTKGWSRSPHSFFSFLANFFRGPWRNFSLYHSLFPPPFSSRSPHGPPPPLQKTPVIKKYFFLESNGREVIPSFFPFFSFFFPPPDFLLPPPFLCTSQKIGIFFFSAYQL